jgi:hypothetical protein
LATGVRQTMNPTTPLCARPNQRLRQSGSGPEPGTTSLTRAR